ncbi:MAG: hypothetical protein R3275_06845 [Saprospiraceae bacterium]|nr:hypothetical protein [Saprospiraceae bacterium]
MQTFLEILKYVVPALIVFLTVYFMFKQFLEGQYRLKEMDYQHKKAERNLPLRLQAYERLALFCERIRPANLFYRLNQKSITREDLAKAMMISIQKEFEHNLSQQIFVSDNLWKIIVLAKDEVLSIIDDSLNEDLDFFVALTKKVQSRKVDPVDQALSAIRKEATFYI